MAECRSSTGMDFRNSLAPPILCYSPGDNAEMTTPSQPLEQAYELARQRFAAIGVDTDASLLRLSKMAISLHCWQGDDVVGFENSGEAIGGGLAVTGNYPGRRLARYFVLSWLKQNRAVARARLTTPPRRRYLWDLNPSMFRWQKLLHCGLYFFFVGTCNSS